MGTTSPRTGAKAPTLAQRSGAVVAEVAVQLQLDDHKRLALALAEIAAEESRRNVNFAQRIATRYFELTPPSTKKASPPPKPVTSRARAPRRVSELAPTVTAFRTPGENIDIVHPLDPRKLVSIYGDRLPEHLIQYTPRGLWEMARILAAAGVGQKAPPLKSGKDSLISYIVHHVSG